MIWLASFPRSGNTFFRNILFEVYGIKSIEFHTNKSKELDPDWSKYTFVKTHLLPSQLPESTKIFRSVYLIRDGRDATISLAHHRKNIKKIERSFYQNIIEITFGIGNMYRCSWGKHVKEWESVADVIIKFEDLIVDPIGEMEKLRKIIDLPSPNHDKVPTFESQKAGFVKYGADKLKSKNEIVRSKSFDSFFRAGKIGGYKKEMPLILLLLFSAVNFFTLRKYYKKDK